MMLKRCFASFATAALLLFGVLLSSATAEGFGERPKARLSLSDMVGQMIVVGFTGTSEQDDGVRIVRQQIASGEVGGVILLARNIANPDQTARLTRSLKRAASGRFSVPPFISIDQEGGRVQRLTNLKGFDDWLSAEDVSALSAERGPSFAITYYGERANSLAEVGINLNFGPVLDLNANPSNPIIGRLERSYSRDANVVSVLGGDFVIAHRNVGVLTSLKHFPGHGSTRSDSHRALPDISDTWHADELLPYDSLGRRGLVDTVMLAHVFHPDFSDAVGRPTSLSRNTVNAARDLIGESVVLFTDDMQMGAITNTYREADAAIMAVNAGVDVLIYSTFETPDPTIGPRINRAIVEAVRRGDIPFDRVRSAYERITALKRQN